MHVNWNYMSTFNSSCHKFFIPDFLIYFLKSHLKEKLFPGDIWLNGADDTGVGSAVEKVSFVQDPSDTYPGPALTVSSC